MLLSLLASSLLANLSKRRLKYLGLSLIRKAQLTQLFKRLKLPICQGYLPLTPDRANAYLGHYGEAVKITTVLDSETYVTRPPVCVNGSTLQALQPISPQIDSVVLDITHPGFSFRNNHLFDERLNVIDEGGKRFAQMPIAKQKLALPQRLKGTIAYLSNVEPTNYYHWMCRTLPLLATYQQRFAIAEIDYFYIGNFKLSDFHLETLKRVGISPDQILQTACCSDRLVAAISNRKILSGAAPINHSSYRFTQQLFAKEVQAATPKQRIYVARGNTTRRKVTNESAVMQVLARHGFESVSMDGRSLLEQVRLFSQAEAVVAPHGAALTNLLFITPGTKVIELMPHGYVNTCFYVLTDYSQGDYFCLGGEETEQGTVAPHWRDLKIDIPKLERMCETAFASSPVP